MDQTQRGREQRFETDGAVCCFGEREALRLDVLRIVIGDDHIDHPFGERLDNRLSIILVAQWWREFEERPVSPMSFSLSVRLLIETPQEIVAPERRALRMISTESAHEIIAA